jgi:phosphopantetheinyl transferase
MAKKGKCYWFILENTRPQKNGLQIRINKQGKPVLARKRKPHLAFGNISLPNGIGRVERIFLYSFKGE